ncbi:hypothetical protein GYA49_03240 [Candidatus Beckwithbacteria bacterium]|nr:hypothetical protein [Candidatus Beckwithbacteria bacterium]
MKIRKNCTSQAGIAPVLIIILILVLLVGADFTYAGILSKCGDQAINECLGLSETQEQVEPEGEVVVATGSFAYKKYSVSISMNIPLEGGVVIGNFSGDCDGQISGSYKGGDGGTISGNVTGSCAPLLVPIPAKGTFTGVVWQEQKTVPLTATGGAAGFSGSGSLTLSY